MAMSTLAEWREEEVFLPRESTLGVQVDPTATDYCLLTGPGTFDQQPERIKDKQVRNARSEFPSIPGRILPGTFKFTTYIKPNPALGSKPESNALWMSTFGVETVVGSTSVGYSFPIQATSTSPNPPTFSIYRRLGHHSYVSRGGGVMKAEFQISGKTEVEATFDGGFIEMAAAAEDVLNGNINNSATTLTLTTGANWYIPANMYFYILIDTEIFKATGVSGNTLTVARGAQSSAAASHTSGALITFWYPTGSEIGTPIFGKFSTVTLASTSYILLDAKVMISTGLVYHSDEMNGTRTASSIAYPGNRTVEIDTSSYLHINDARDFPDAVALTRFAFVIQAGSVSGNEVIFTAPYAEKSAPTMSGTGEVTSSMKFKIVSVVGAADTEINVLFQ